MISKPTLLILGAGASKPYGFPLGSELKNQIINGLSTPQETFCVDVMNACGCTWDVVDKFRRTFDASEAPSIDKFLESQTEETIKIAKVCIARALIPCEVPTELNGQKAKQHDEEDERWYAEFFEKLLPNDPNEFRKNMLSVITYNYDRSFEQCLFVTIQEKYEGIKEKEIREVFFDHIDILHLHGVLGQLPSIKPSETSRPYEPIVSDKALRDAASKIIVVHEATYDKLSQHGFQTAQHRIDNAHVVCFLGFAYHDPILEFIFQESTAYAQSEYKHEMLGTCFRLTEDRKKEIKGRFAKLDLCDLTVKAALKEWGDYIFAR